MGLLSALQGRLFPPFCQESHLESPVSCLLLVQETKSHLKKSFLCQRPRASFLLLACYLGGCWPPPSCRGGCPGGGVGAPTHPWHRGAGAEAASQPGRRGREGLWPLPARKPARPGSEAQPALGSSQQGEPACSREPGLLPVALALCARPSLMARPGRSS